MGCLRITIVSDEFSIIHSIVSSIHLFSYETRCAFQSGKIIALI